MFSDAQAVTAYDCPKSPLIFILYRPHLRFLGFLLDFVLSALWCIYRPHLRFFDCLLDFVPSALWCMYHPHLRFSVCLLDFVPSGLWCMARKLCDRKWLNCLRLS